ncbi:hypothetical protein [Aureibacter tunicatorum]|uniref:Uncharacterized protein n=1 Tax=Aureibacter tunicatorum TaxID=866807 RepID=A0AAE3XJN3_9BACT|nr:hypothetical protein [Aureibacter tunicatorum]MDR6238112.1 hypothetical protein [Aureibacter tunicatorum]BDD03145.1 hypothetical protein AUTU_06280 [Aureibacter tunicatorum]
MLIIIFKYPNEWLSSTFSGVKWQAKRVMGFARQISENGKYLGANYEY